MNLHVTRATDANNGKQNRTQTNPIQPQMGEDVTRIKQNLFKDCALN